MASRSLPRSEWQTYFTRLDKTLRGKAIRIEVVGATIGDQILTESSPVLGIAYEPKQNMLEIFLDGIDHIVEKPQMVSVRENDGELLAIEIVDADQRHQIVTLGKSSPN